MNEKICKYGDRDCVTGRGTIFIVTTLEIRHPPPDKEENFLPETHYRTVGWFPELKMAVDEVLSNAGDIHENSYQYCVIEETRWGIYPIPPLSELWYCWSKEKGQYMLGGKPKEVDIVVNFGIG